MLMKTETLLLEALKEHLDKEPQAPDLEVHIGHHLEIVARRYNEWEKTKNALYLLLGVRLVNRALEEL